MTKSDLAEKLAEKINVNKQHAEGIINMFTNSIIEALAKGDKVEIRGFGSFRVRERAAKEGRNPKTGEKVYVPKGLRAAEESPVFQDGQGFPRDRKQVTTLQVAAICCRRCRVGGGN